jgi:hypothetical protein
LILLCHFKMKDLLTDGKEGVCIGEIDAHKWSKGEILVKVPHVGLDLPAEHAVGCHSVGTVIGNNG